MGHHTVDTTGLAKTRSRRDSVRWEAQHTCSATRHNCVTKSTMAVEDSATLQLNTRSTTTSSTIDESWSAFIRLTMSCACIFDLLFRSKNRGALDDGKNASSAFAPDAVTSSFALW